MLKLITLKFTCNCAICDKELIKWCKRTNTQVWYNTETKKITCGDCQNDINKREETKQKHEYNKLHINNLIELAKQKAIEVKESKTGNIILVYSFDGTKERESFETIDRAILFIETFD